MGYSFIFVVLDCVGCQTIGLFSELENEVNHDAGRIECQCFERR